MTGTTSTPQRVPADWTVDPDTGSSNSSAQFISLVEFVSKLIRGSATSLIAGQTNTVGRTIMAQLAHKKGLVPADYQGVRIESARYEDGRLVGVLVCDGQRLKFTTEFVLDPTS